MLGYRADTDDGSFQLFLIGFHMDHSRSLTHRMIPCTVLCGLLLMLPALAAQELPPIRSVEGITEYRLDNGLQVLLFPDESSPKVTVNLTVFVGSRHEGYGEAGMAHLLEHMLYKGTPTFPQIPAELRKRGADYNGTTWLDRTNYYETMPASEENLDFALRLEADRMVNSFIKAEDLASEMTVVRSEFERGENSPQRILMQRIMAAAFEWHNYGQTTIGNRADIERVPVANLRRFYQRFYQPDNAMLVVAGKFDPPKALELVQKYFGALPKPERELDRTYTEEPAQDGERLVTLRRVGDVPMAGVQYHIPSGAHPDFAVADVLTSVLTTEPGGRLYDRLVTRKIAAAQYGISFGLHDPGVILFLCDGAQGIDAPTLLQNLIEAVETAAETPFTAEEVDRAKSELLKQRELQMADAQGIAIELSEWAAQGDWRLFFLHRDRLEAVTPDDVTRVAKAYLIRTNRTAGMFDPTKEPERATIPATPDVADMLKDYKGRTAVAQGEAFDSSPLAIEARLQRSKLASGMKVTLLPKKTRGAQVTLRINLRYGNADALKGLATATTMLPEMLNRGTENMTRQQINDQLNNYRAQMSVSGSPGVLSVTVQTGRENLLPVLGLVEEVLRHPKFPAEELEVVREEQLSLLNQQFSDPGALAFLSVSKKLAPYEPDDARYVPTIEEGIERMKAVSVDQIREAYSKLLSSSVGDLTIVGDFDTEAVVESVDRFTEGWTSEVPFARLARVHVDNKRGKVESINTPDKPNAAYVAGMTIPMKDSDPDFAAITIGNFILGGDGLSSRLGNRVRQQDGLSYTIQSGLQPSAVDERTAFLIFAISNPENSSKVHQAIQEELKILLEEGVTQEELDAAKAGYLQEQQVQRTDDGSLTQMLEVYSFIGRDMKFVADFEERIQKLTVEDVNAALKKHIDPKRLFVVMAGDFDAAVKAKK